LLLLAAEPAVPPVDADAASGEIAEQAPAEAERATDLSPLQEIDLLTTAGAPELALDVLGSSQPEYSSDPDGWRRHEQLRVEILRRSGNWQALAEQLADLPEGLAIADRRWTSTVRAQALLEIDQPAEALEIARSMIWEPAPVAAVEMATWRRILIRAYRGLGELQAARTAIRRFQQDYDDTSRDWTLERARLALRVDEPEEAVALLADATGNDAEILKIIADFRSGSQSAAAAIDRAVKFGVNKEIAPELRREAWAFAAEAAGSINNRTARIAALERGLVLPAGSRPTLSPLSADALWDDYIELGTELGNELQLIVGDDEAWFLAASNRYDDQPIHARALFAVVAMKAYRPDQAAVAHWQFAELLDTVPSGGKLMQALYLDSRRFDGPQDIAPQVRYLLLEHVLAKPDIPLASQLLQGLQEPPPKTPAFDWLLRRARVLLLGGDIPAGIDALERLMAEAGNENFDRDKVLQVIFDLQTLERHEAALRFFSRLAELPAAPQPQRELWYWRADSLAALDRHVEAARAYLKSALLHDRFAADPWAQTSRFQAADQLLAAGMYEDARQQYQTLLNSTRDPGRQAVIRNRLQELQLRAESARSVTDSSSVDADNGNEQGRNAVNEDNGVETRAIDY
ncbi:MAG: hypothetical protein R3270_09335, partial [Gammaproteobacteria bacterium]|nr:hypothetical protein [Gammaproteobacteria bacterium]